MSHVLGWTECHCARFPHTTQNGAQFEMYELFILVIFHLILSDSSWLQITETTNHETAGKRELLTVRSEPDWLGSARSSHAVSPEVGENKIEKLLWTVFLYFFTVIAIICYISLCYMQLYIKSIYSASYIFYAIFSSSVFFILFALFTFVQKFQLIWHLVYKPSFMLWPILCQNDLLCS